MSTFLLLKCKMFSFSPAAIKRQKFVLSQISHKKISVLYSDIVLHLLLTDVGTLFHADFTSNDMKNISLCYIS